MDAGSAPEEIQENSVQLFPVRGGESVRRALQHLETTALDGGRGLLAGDLEGNDLIRVAVHHERGNGELLQILPEIGVAECGDAFPGANRRRRPGNGLR